MATSIDDGITTVILQGINDINYGTPQIQSLRNSKESQMMYSAIPNKDSSGAIGFDIFGVKREITIQGFVIGTKQELEKFFVDTEGLIDGGQWNLTAHSLTFKVDIDTEQSYSVIMKTFSWVWDKGVPNRINYTMILLEVDPNRGES